MDVSGVVPKPKPRGPQSLRAPGLAALAAIKDAKRRKQVGEDSGLNDPISIKGKVLSLCAHAHVCVCV